MVTHYASLFFSRCKNVITSNVLTHNLKSWSSRLAHKDPIYFCSLNEISSLKSFFYFHVFWCKSHLFQRTYVTTYVTYHNNSHCDNWVMLFTLYSQSILIHLGLIRVYLSETCWDNSVVFWLIMLMFVELFQWIHKNKH